ncbi:hypothetical protein [Oceanidesulfovibrio marinus]|nr:hypothetical protein [Oceanidesulfovibrio marinus]
MKTSSSRPEMCARCAEDGMWQVFQAGDIPAQPVAKKQPKTKAKKGKAMPKGHKKCPNCGSDVLSTNMACWHCGYDFKAKSMPAQNEPENATSGDDGTCYDGGAMKSAQAEAKNPGQDALNKIGEKGGRAWKTGFRTLQINMPEDDPLFRKIEETADQFGVKPGKVAEWLLRGLPFELVEPEQAEA